MPLVLCSPPLWRLVRAWRSAESGAAADSVGGGTLATWSATVFRRGARDILVSVEMETWLTLVCELGSETTFPARWKQSLATAFEDMRVPLPGSLREHSVPRLRKADDDRQDASLASVGFVCDTELHFQPDLRIVQRRLNEFPHDHPPHYVPLIAVRRLLALRG